MIKKLAIYCGSSAGVSDSYREGAERLADVLSEAGIAIVYGGAKVGLMRVIADRMLANGGTVIGVIPQALVDVEVAHDGLTELHVVANMHDRKALIAELADGFIMMPGGPGSLDEFFEMITWSQLGYHTKPCGILNINGYYDRLLDFLDHVVGQGFMKEPHRNMIIVNNEPRVILNQFRQYQAPSTEKWVNRTGALAVSSSSV